tara:strand:- start:199 stop:888 length:690 start_codon:yes stop_codon:yes gene_type:complete
MKNTLLVIIQARMKSSRLPGKVLKKIDKENILEKILNSLKKCENIDGIIIATSKHKSDNKIVNFCIKNKVNYFRGDLKNVSSRFYNILKKKNYDFFLRVCADSPFLDFKNVKKFIKIAKKSKYNIITNTLNRTFPKGQSIEIFKTNFFVKNFKKIKNKNDLEHVSKYFYKNKEKFKIKNISLSKNLSHINLCVDTPDDLRRAKKITKIIERKFKSNFSMKNLVKVFKIS